MVFVLERGAPRSALWVVPCALLALPVPGCAAGPRARAPAPEEAGPGTWADGLDELVFGDGGAAEEEEAAAARPAPAAADARGADLEMTAALAVEAVREDRLEDAAPLLEEAAALASGEERWLYERGLADVLLALGRSAEAARIYEGLLASGRAAGAETLGNLAAAYLREGDAARSRAAAMQALDIRPGSPEATKTLGLAEILDGERERGAETLREALDADPAIPEALLALAEIDEETGDAASALERYRKLLDLLAAVEAGGEDPGRRLRGLFLFRPAKPPGEGRRAPPRGTREELEARIQRLEGRTKAQ